MKAHTASAVTKAPQGSRPRHSTLWKKNKHPIQGSTEIAFRHDQLRGSGFHFRDVTDTQWSHSEGVNCHMLSSDHHRSHTTKYLIRYHYDKLTIQGLHTTDNLHNKQAVVLGAYHAHKHEKSKKKSHLHEKSRPSCHPLRKACFFQYQALSATLEWRGDGDCLMHRMQSGGLALSI